MVVLPQRGHRIRDGLAAAYGRHDVHRTVDRELMQERRRQFVQEVGVVDTDDDIAVGEQ